MKKPSWDNGIPKLGTCCMFDAPPLDAMNMGTCTLTSANKDATNATNKAISNATRLVEMLTFLSTQPKDLRYFRISSELFPCYTAPGMAKHYKKVMPVLQTILDRAGLIAKSAEIRLSTHPAQFTVLASKDKSVVKKSIADIEYHALFFEMMNIPATHGIVNIHLQGRYGDPDHMPGIKRFATNFTYLNDYAQAILTVENEDKPNGYDIVHTLELAQLIPIRTMFDAHHYCCYRKDLASMLDPTSDIFKAHLATWKDVRPAMHASQSGNPKRMLEHSASFDDRAVADKIAAYLPFADIECEVKNKWTAVTDFYQYLLSKVV